MSVIFKILLKLFFLFFIIQGFCYLIVFIYPITKHTNAPQELGYNYINQILNQKQVPEFYNRILNIGDSSAATAFHNKMLGEDVMTLGVWGSSPAELYFYLHKYLATYKAPKCILISHILSSDYYRDHSFWELVVPYSNLTIDEYSKLYDISKNFNEFPGNSENKLTFLIKILATKHHFFLATPNIYLEKLKYRNKDMDIINKIIKTFEITKGEYARLVRGSEVRGEWWSFFNHPMPKSNYYDFYYDLIINEATANNIKIYSVTPPFSEKLAKLYPERLSQLINYYQLKSAQFKNVEHINLSMYFPDNHYIDDAHLNFYGSSKFTRKLSNFIDCQ